ncbi:nuclear transport factor 2 family protein [Ferrovibrio sp.]|uniref:nuclear transport factor 2 family protein n=1 Tax=Ferrovibrio sp. TaxID=1917215 RepID=UPI00312006A9
MGAVENRETVRRIYAAMAQGDLTAFGGAVHPDYVWRLAGHASWSQRFEGQEAVRSRLLKPLFALFATQYRAQAVNIVAEGDFVVAEVRGDVMTRRGDRYNNEYCLVFRFRGDRIAELVEYCDTDLIERVLGPYDTAVAPG